MTKNMSEEHLEKATKRNCLSPGNRYDAFSRPKMKIVTYNVNGLRPRISQYGSLRKFLDSLDADIVCVQETKLSRQELRADVVWADGYESFFSCTRSSERGRTGYSGVATFCRVNSAFSSKEVSLPLDAEEGFTGVLENTRGFKNKKGECPAVVEGLHDFSRDELLKIDSEGRCLITDHSHFVLFNIYGPRADSDDAERIEFKVLFFKILQRRWESYFRQGRRVFVVGDFNIAPYAVDRCDAGPDFENNEFRRWLRSVLVENGGPFTDIFRAKHPDSREAYTCWSTSTGAEVFNFGSRIDHILIAGSCLHESQDVEGHNFLTCHVKECDILTQFKRWKPENKTSHNWKGSRNFKLEGSDHAPVSASLLEIPDTVLHDTPPLSTRYCPQVQGCQQTLVSMLKRQQSTKEEKAYEQTTSLNEENSVESCNQLFKRSIQACSATALSSSEHLAASSLISQLNRPSQCVKEKKKPKRDQSSQLSLKSFFQKSLDSSNRAESSISDATRGQTNLSSNSTTPSTSLDQAILSSRDFSDSMSVDDGRTLDEPMSGTSVSLQHSCELNAPQTPMKDKKNVALLEWGRIQQLMQNSIPVCKGHKEPCVVRVVKKAGPTLGRRFYVCSRAEGPASNPEANCGYFKWADLKRKGAN